MKEKRVFTMDLTSYAVERKLANPSDELFDLVIANKDIPTSVLKDSIKPLIDSRHNNTIETMVHDYPRYLQDNVQLNIIRQGDGKFKIAGHIDDGIVDCITQMHNVEQDEMVRHYVRDLMEGMNTDKEVVIDKIEIGDTPYVPEKKDIIAESIQDEPVMRDEPAVAPQAPAVKDNYDAPVNDNQEYMGETEEIPDYTSDLDMSGFEPDIPEQPMDIPESAPTDTVQAPQTELPPVDVPDPTPDLEFNPSPLSSSPIDSVPEDMSEMPAFEEPEFEEPDESQETTVSNPEEFKKAYDYVVGQIKEKELDKKLPGLHIN